MEIPLDAHIPPKYIPREKGRISMYKRISWIHDIDSFRDVQDELIDRYGDIPRPVQVLLDISLLKAKAQELALLTVSVKQEEAKLTFSSHAQISPEKFFSVVSGISGAQVIEKTSQTGGSANSTMVLQIRQRKKTPEDMFEITKTAVDKLLKCVSE